MRLAKCQALPLQGPTEPGHLVAPSGIRIENVNSAINQIAQTTLRKVVGQHTLDETLSETDRINLDIRRILDVTTTEWGVTSPWSNSRTSNCPTP
ncbi:SPFH domain-containing protein [Kitasatospora sp. NPDC001159]